MHALIIVSHPNPTSLSHSVAAHVGEGIAQSDPANGFEIADLAAERFDPSYNAADVAAYRRKAPLPADVVAEQSRIDRADALVLVYPVYWWSMPAQLKGWIDRVFTNGWAYDMSESEVVKKLRRLKVHLVAIGGADLRTYARHGYFGAMRTQIDHGIFDYCGARVVTSELLVDSEIQDALPQLEAARAIGGKIFSASASADASMAA